MKPTICSRCGKPEPIRNNYAKLLIKLYGLPMCKACREKVGNEHQTSNKLEKKR